MRLLLVGFGILSFALSTSADPLAERGKRIAVVNCAGCHAVSVDDVSRHSEAPPLRELSRQYPVDALAEALAEGIYTGHPDMPAFQASPDQIDALLTYLASRQVQ